MDGTGGVDKTPIDTTEHIKYYADVDDNGTVDGIIFADLAVGGSGQWYDEDGAFSYEAKVQGTPPGYYIKEENHIEEKWGEHPVIAPINTGYDRTQNYRFYVMELKDEKGKDKKGADTTYFCWYDAAYGIANPSDTSLEFGTGRRNTATMLSKWRQQASGYGTRNDNSTYKDVWSLWGEDDETLNKTDVQEKDLEWFLPSRAEWACFGKTFEITSSNYNKQFGLSVWYWSSSLVSTDSDWAAIFDFGYMNGSSLDGNDYVRLCTTF